ncbi:MAG: hypothetical protein JNK25_10810 [Phycisphaerae bacterium]|nr:hypothetical protein [Phycisphaerae bacterium]
MWRHGPIGEVHPLFDPPLFDPPLFEPPLFDPPLFEPVGIARTDPNVTGLLIR